MLKSMLALGKMQFNQYNIYKSNFYLFTLNRIVEIVVYIFVWQAIYYQTGDAGGYTINQMITYYILVFTLSSLSCWGVNEDIAYSLFLAVILLGIPVTFFFTMIIGLVGFYSSSIWGMQILRKSIICIFSGLIAPITLFPKWFQVIANVLPFKELIYTPINIWLGQVSMNDIILVMIKQIIWIGVLYGIAKMFFNHAVKKVTINGG